MNEIERAIEFMYGERTKAASMYLKNTDERVIALIDRVGGYYDAAIKALRAELSRQEDAPMTCDGCKNQEGMYVDDNLCYDCRRYTTLPDRYEPKGEKE